MRIYTPLKPKGGAVAYFHGGGWVVGSIDSFDTACRALANACGAMVVSVGYRLAPEHPFPAGAGGLRAAIRARRRIDAPLAVAGDSAGGNLAIAVARRLRDQVAGMALIYPVTDAGLNTPSMRDFKERYGLTAAGLQRYWNLYLDGADGFQPDASPLRADDLEGLPPTYVLTSEFDVLRDEGEAFVKKLREAGVDVTHRRFDGTIHGFWRWMAATPKTREAIDEVGAALAAHPGLMLRELDGDGRAAGGPGRGRGPARPADPRLPGLPPAVAQPGPRAGRGRQARHRAGLRGFGESDGRRTSPPTRMRHSIADMVAVLDALEIERAQVVGHDWGAAVAWGLAAFVPERVERLAVRSVGHPRALAEPTSSSGRSPGTAAVPVEDVAERCSSATTGGCCASGCGSRRRRAVHRRPLAPGRADRGLNWYRANMAPGGSCRSGGLPAVPIRRSGSGAAATTT